MGAEQSSRIDSLRAAMLLLLPEDGTPVLNRVMRLMLARKRGVDGRLATLAARTGMAAFGHATLAWFEDPERGLANHLDGAFQALWDITRAGRT